MIISVVNPPIVGNVLLGKLSSANLNITTDQAITLLGGNKLITSIMFINSSETPTLAAGGFYTGAGKTGTVLVSTGQVYTALVASLSLNVTIALNYVTGTVIYFSLTTGNGTACTADIFVYGQLLI